MNQDPEHEDYDDDEYNYYPQYNEYGYPEYSKKFNIDWAAWEKWLSKTIKEIVEEDENIWVFSSPYKKEKPSYDQEKSKKIDDKYFIYLGNNHYNEPIWKAKYFVLDKIAVQYKKHISYRPKYLLIQPNYYKSMFEILN